MSITDMERRQQACEVVLNYVDELIAQGIGRAKAIDHAVQRYGCARPSLVKLINERDYGLLGTSGQSEFFVTDYRALAGT